MPPQVTTMMMNCVLVPFFLCSWLRPPGGGGCNAHMLRPHPILCRTFRDPDDMGVDETLEKVEDEQDACVEHKDSNESKESEPLRPFNASGGGGRLYRS